MFQLLVINKLILLFMIASCRAQLFGRVLEPKRHHVEMDDAAYLEDLVVDGSDLEQVFSIHRTDRIGHPKWKPFKFISNELLFNEGVDDSDNEIDDTNPELEVVQIGDGGEKKKKKKPPKLNVSQKDSPYALINKHFPERERFHDEQRKRLDAYSANRLEYDDLDTDLDLGGLRPSEVWLADGDMLVLRGGSTNDRDGFDDPWKPIDDYQAPYREPVFPKAEQLVTAGLVADDDADEPPPPPPPPAAEEERDDDPTVPPPGSFHPPPGAAFVPPPPAMLRKYNKSAVLASPGSYRELPPRRTVRPPVYDYNIKLPPKQYDPVIEESDPFLDYISNHRRARLSYVQATTETATPTFETPTSPKATQIDPFPFFTTPKSTGEVEADSVRAENEILKTKTYNSHSYESTPRPRYRSTVYSSVGKTSRTSAHSYRPTTRPTLPGLYYDGRHQYPNTAIPPRRVEGWTVRDESEVSTTTPLPDASQYDFGKKLTKKRPEAKREPSKPRRGKQINSHSIGGLRYVNELPRHRYPYPYGETPKETFRERPDNLYKINTERSPPPENLYEITPESIFTVAAPEAVFSPKEYADKGVEFEADSGFAKRSKHRPNTLPTGSIYSGRHGIRPFRLYNDIAVNYINNHRPYDEDAEFINLDQQNPQGIQLAQKEQALPKRPRRGPKKLSTTAQEKSSKNYVSFYRGNIGGKAFGYSFVL